MTVDELEFKLDHHVGNERRESLAVIQLVAEALKINAHAQRGHPNLLRWLVSRFKYAEDAAYRRLAAARVLLEVPAAGAKLEHGDVTLSALARVNSAVRAQEKATGVKVDKARVVESVEGLSLRQIDLHLLEVLPATIGHARQERAVHLDANTDRVTVNLSRDDMRKLEQIRDLLSHAKPNASKGELISLAITELHAKLVKRANKNQGVKLASCTFRDERSGTTCGSTYMLEEDHVRPRALGGGDEPENLRPLCRVHNQLEAERLLGVAWANAWRTKR